MCLALQSFDPATSQAEWCTGSNRAKISSSQISTKIHNTVHKMPCISNQQNPMIGVHARLKVKVSFCYSDCVVPVVQGFYFTGDGCKRDEDGYYWITGKELMHRAGADFSMNGMPASHSVQHSRPWSPKTLMCLCMPCQPFGAGMQTFAVHPSVCPSLFVPLSSSFIIDCCETSV